MKLFKIKYFIPIPFSVIVRLDQGLHFPRQFWYLCVCVCARARVCVCVGGGGGGLGARRGSVRLVIVS